MRPGDSYFWIHFQTLAENLELDQYQLFELGALGTEEEVAIGEIGPDSTPEERVLGAAPTELLAGMSVTLKATFSEPASWKRACEYFQNRPGLQFGEAANEDWDRSWREQQSPVAVTTQLTVTPPWVEAPNNANQVHVIRLEAKRAFGTGQHESTQLAAELLEQIGSTSNYGEKPPSPTSPLRNKRILDIGTGTGILAIYASFLGAQLSIGFDIDPVAGPCLRENSQLNPLQNRERGVEALWFVGTTDSLKQPTAFDVVICNMIRTEWWPFRKEIVAVTRQGGEIVVSGQRVDDQEKMEPWLKEAGLHIVNEAQRNGWWAFTARHD